MKYNNKWYSYIYEANLCRRKIQNVFAFLVRMMWKIGSSYEEIKLEKNEDIGPHCMFRICYADEIFDVMSDLVEL